MNIMSHDELCDLMMKHISYSSYSYDEFKELMDNKFNDDLIYFYNIEKAVQSSRYYDSDGREIHVNHNESFSNNNKIDDLYKFIKEEFPQILMSKGRMRERYLLGLINFISEEKSGYYDTSNYLISYISSEDIYDYLIDLGYIEKPSLANKI